MPNVAATTLTITPIDSTSFNMDYTEAGAPPPPTPSPSGGSGGNLLINPQFQISQRASTFSPANGEYTIDRWKAASDGFSIAKSGAGADMTLTGTVGGIMQIIESVNSGILEGELLSYSFSAKITAGTPTLKSALIGWSGTADKPTNPVTAWGATPTLAASWSYIAAAQTHAVTGTIALFSGEDTVPAGVNNVALLVWIEGVASDGVHLTKTKVEVGSATPFSPRLFDEEQNSCWRYYQKFTSATLHNTDHGYGRTDATNANLTLPLYAPMRGALGSAGTADVSVDWSDFGANVWFMYANGAYQYMTSKPTLTCFHGYFAHFQTPRGSIRAHEPLIFRTSVAGQSISIDAEI